jgi:hypothetical protein
MSETDRCSLYEPGGQLLATGYCALADTAVGTGTVLMVVLDRPGRLMARSLVGQVRDIRLHHADGRVVQGQIARLYFDPRRGRMCELQVSSAVTAQPILAR